MRKTPISSPLLLTQEAESVTIVFANNLGTMTKTKVEPNVIRLHQCSITKEPELHFYNKMLPFLPWRNEATDLVAGYET